MLPGKYRVVATDALGASNYEDIEVKSEVAAMKPYTRIRATIKGLVSIRVYVNPKSSGPFVCKWGKISSRSCNFTDVPSFGPDVVHVTSGEGCTEAAELNQTSVLKPLTASVKAFVLDSTCQVPKTITNLTIVPRNGVPPYLFSWTHLDSTKPASKEMTLSDLNEAGMLTFNMSDSFGSVLIGKVMISPALDISWVKGLMKKKSKKKI